MTTVKTSPWFWGSMILIVLVFGTIGTADADSRNPNEGLLYRRLQIQSGESLTQRFLDVTIPTRECRIFENRVQIFENENQLPILSAYDHEFQPVILDFLHSLIDDTQTRTPLKQDTIENQSNQDWVKEVYLNEGQERVVLEQVVGNQRSLGAQSHRASLIEFFDHVCDSY